MTATTCPVCEGRSIRTHLVREMMYGLRTRFNYGQCGTCGTLWLLDPPADWGVYYRPDYYSFGIDWGTAGFKARLKARICCLPGVWRLAGADKRLIYQSRPPRSGRILDVGCGSGALIKLLRAAGWPNAWGIEPNAKESTEAVQKKWLADMDGRWDLIMFHHSFEHILNPVETMASVRRLLAPGGKCLVRLPVATWAWSYYGADWVQWDAPRHVVIYTPGGLGRLAQRCGFRVTLVDYDSNLFQFQGSELYRKGIPWVKACEHPFPPGQIREWQRRARDLNRTGQGDQAGFVLELEGNGGA